jgi:hypothetical protein
MSRTVVIISALGLLLGLALLFRRGWIAVVLGGLLLGPSAYFGTGVWLARERGIGQFHSVPFGGMSVGDTEIVWSLAFWILGTSLVIGTAVSVASFIRGGRKRSREP